MDLKTQFDSPIFHLVAKGARDTGNDIFIVGGYVRDLFLQRKSKDIDFVTTGSGIEVASKVSELLGNKSKLSVFPNYGTAQVKLHDLELEFVGARKESYIKDSRNPIIEAGTLKDDLTRRDFTINAMAISLNEESYGSLIDPFEGLNDLQKGIIKTPTDPDITFSDDPLRMLRAIRFVAQLDRSLESDSILPHNYPHKVRLTDETMDAVRRNASRMSIITRERINDELGKIMRSSYPSIGWKLLEKSNLLPYVFPALIPLKGVEIKEGKGHKDNFYHTLQVVDNVAVRSENEWLRWAALMHDIAKPVTKKYNQQTGWTFHNHNFIGEKMVPVIFKEMKLPLNEKMKYVAKLVGLHMRPQSVGENGVTDSGVRRLITDAGNDLDDLMILAESDITSKNPDKVRNQLQGFCQLRKRIEEINDADALRNWKNPINGNEIIDKLNIPEGPQIARLKSLVKEAILEGKIPYDHDAAWQFLEEICGKEGIL